MKRLVHNPSQLSYSFWPRSPDRKSCTSGCRNEALWRCTHAPTQLPKAKIQPCGPWSSHHYRGEMCCEPQWTASRLSLEFQAWPAWLSPAHVPRHLTHKGCPAVPGNFYNKPPSGDSMFPLPTETSDQWSGTWRWAPLQGSYITTW